MVERGFTDPRYAEERPSLSRLAEECGVHTSTISAAIRGSGRRPSAETIAALVDALGPDAADWLGSARSVEWKPPAEAALLTDRQRRAVEEIIRAMTERAEVPSNVTPLPTPEALDPTLPTAAYPKKGRDSEGRRIRRGMDAVGEESQDDGEDS